MAEFIIMARDNNNPDPIKDERACYKLGDIVEVRPDGSEYGKEEKYPVFFIVKVPGLDFQTARQYMVTHHILEDAGGGEVKMSMMKRRKFKVDWDILPQAVKDELLATGEYTVAWNTVKRFVRNKVTGILEG